MTLSNEWEEMHLTPNGWVQGSSKLDCGTKEVIAVPSDAVLTVRRHVVVGAIGANPRVNMSESKYGNSDEAIAKLRKKFGEPKFGV